MQKADLSDAYLKLARAKQHIADVEAGIGRFLSSDFYQFTFELDQRKGRLQFRFQSLHKPDKALNCLIGDALSNLRSILDYAVVGIAYPYTGDPSKSQFPFADDASGFEGQVKSPKSLGPTPQAIIDLFLNQVQAYKGGLGEAFWTLNKLRNIDKHRLLLTTTELAGAELSFRTSNGITFTDCTFEMKAGQQTTILDSTLCDVQFTKKPRPIFLVEIEEPGVVQGVEINLFLKEMAEGVESFLNSLKPFI